MALSMVKTVAETRCAKGHFARRAGRKFPARLEQEAALRMLMNNLDPEVAENRKSWWCTVEPESGAQLGMFSPIVKSLRGWRMTKHFCAIGKPVGFSHA